MSAGIVKYFETDGFGRKLRTLYLLDGHEAPDAIAGAEWRQDANFDRATALLDDPSLKEVFKAALARGFEIVSAPARSV